jgi:hypothetical protein
MNAMAERKPKPVQIRQGDVLLDPCQEPEGLIPIDPHGDWIVLAEGEATGHRHVVPAADARLLAASDGGHYLRVVRPTPLTHEEHQPAIDLVPVTYRVVRDREYDEFGVTVARD